MCLLCMLDSCFVADNVTAHEQTSHKVIEKRRRDRINNCLFELSQTVPAAFSKQTSGKLEKAEILEMTVDYLRAVQTTEIGVRFDNGEWFSTDIWGDFAHHYQAGYNECVREVLKYMADVEGIAISDNRCARLLSFLHNRFRAESATVAPGANSSSASSAIPATGAGNDVARGARGSYVTSTTSRSSFVSGGSGVIMKTRDVTVLNSGVKTVPSSAAVGSPSLDSRLFTFPPFLPPQAISSCSSGSGGDSRPPLHPSTTFSGLNVVPSAPFRPLPPLSIPGMDLRFQSYAAREAGSYLAAGVGTAGNKDVLSMDLHPGLALSASVRKDACLT
ncbi:hypothetical protein ACOMHN_049995 [Nucella lapillus]